MVYRQRGKSWRNFVWEFFGFYEVTLLKILTFLGALPVCGF